MDYTHKLAVALGYDPEKFDAPFVIAKGKEELAEKIIKEAEKAGVPVVSSPELVRRLYKLELLQEIPDDLYVAVAQILVFVQNL
ncbi:MAG TPA: EscU/YscU/HrcU family type III secretion system export apparatus switch protein [Pseudothermotoga sp.]|nr:EscU/YscU/HrcU family type III secretion system export apparatus switch protein [Pseudothermotoga sp.]HOK82668.1 EscU/YscU/HrcU family type III secretion system export apparatus switch protein [Pseudothermotoga sp.]HPP70429.1 EscU/YscU/HrcU family type III secretion system export apparatus switch protein [Pseudothermotoga sp.]